MQFNIHIVADGELPEGVEKVIVERTSGPPLLLICGESARTWRFVKAWEESQPTQCPDDPMVLRAV